MIQSAKPHPHSTAVLRAAPGLFWNVSNWFLNRYAILSFLGDTCAKHDLVMHPLDWGRMQFFKSSMLPCCTKRSFGKWIHCSLLAWAGGERYVFFFFQIYTPTNVTSRQAPKNCSLTSMRILLPPTWRRRHGWICCNDSCFLVILVWHINIWRLDSWHLSNILGPYEQIHFSDWWAMVWKHLAKAWGIPRETK